MKDPINTTMLKFEHNNKATYITYHYPTEYTSAYITFIYGGEYLRFRNTTELINYLKAKYPEIAKQIVFNQTTKTFFLKDIK